MQRRIILFIGPSGSGKTHEVSKVVKDIDRIAIFDMVKDAQYLDDKKTVVIDGNLRQFGNEIKQDKKAFKVVYHPKNVEPLENGLVESPEFGYVVRLCHARGDMYLVIDEAHLWCNSYNCPTDLMMANLVGRHNEFSMILVAQRVTGIHPAIRENTDEFYFWKIINPASLKVIEENCGKDVAEQVKNLRAVELDDKDNFKSPGQMLHWTKFRGVVEVTE